MNIIYLLIPLALILVGIIIWLFLWAVKTDQFEDMEGPAYRILMDNDDTTPKQTDDSDKSENKSDT